MTVWASKCRRRREGQVRVKLPRTTAGRKPLSISPPRIALTSVTWTRPGADQGRQAYLVGQSIEPPETPTPRPMLKRSLVLLALLSVAPNAVLAQTQEAPVADLTTIRNYLEISDRLTTSGQIAYDQIPLLREQGYEVVVNLATADQDRNSLEGFHVTASGMTYIHIPVEWEQPRLSDLSMFFDVMEANRDRKLFVHCFANMRASAFVYVYRTLVRGDSEEEALTDMHEVWDPGELEQWASLIERARSEFSGS